MSERALLHGTIMSVSVIIPTYNSHYLREALDSVFAQSLLPSEIILVDSSPDSTLSTLKDYRDHIVYFHQSPQGVSAARNFGLQKAQGKYLALLDADDVWLADKLQKQVSLLERNQGIGFSFSTVWNLINGEQGKIPSEPFFPPALRRWIVKGIQHEGAVSGLAYDLLLDVNCIATSSLVIRRDAIDKIGLFDESLNNGEDYDFELRLAREFPALFITEPTSRYRVHEAGLSGIWMARSELFYQANLKVLEKHQRLYPSPVVKRAIACAYDDYALHRLKIGDSEMAATYAWRSLRTRPSLTAFKCYAEAVWPNAYSFLSVRRGITRHDGSKG
jgi:glycosyltransferase involved in cell wall biosynthesis